MRSKRSKSAPDRGAHAGAVAPGGAGWQRIAARAALPAALWIALCGAAASAQEPAHPLGTGAQVPEQPLQELLKKRRPKGHISVAVPLATVLAAEAGVRKAACMPQILVINSSNQTMEEMVVGIRYKKAGKELGSTLTRFYLVKTGKQDTHAFPQPLDWPACDELTGELDVIHCMYDSGASCSADVRALDYGAIPLKLMDKK